MQSTVHTYTTVGIRFLCTVQVVRFLYSAGSYKSAHECHAEPIVQWALQGSKYDFVFGLLSARYSMKFVSFTICFNNDAHVERATPTEHIYYIS